MTVTEPWDHDQALAMHRQGATYAEVGARFGCAASTAGRRLNPARRDSDQQTARRWKAGNRDHHVAYNRDRYAAKMEDAAWGECKTCGTGLSERAGKAGLTECIRCTRAREEVARRCARCDRPRPASRAASLCMACTNELGLQRTQAMVDGWLAGLTAPQVAERIEGVTNRGVLATISALRVAGHPIPRRVRGRGPVKWATPPPAGRIVVRRGDVSAGVRGERVV